MSRSAEWATCRGILGTPIIVLALGCTVPEVVFTATDASTDDAADDTADDAATGEEEGRRRGHGVPCSDTSRRHNMLRTGAMHRMRRRRLREM
jgi:hypothetical protein